MNVCVCSTYFSLESRNRKRRLAARCKEFMEELVDSMGVEAVLLVGFKRDNGEIGRSM